MPECLGVSVDGDSSIDVGLPSQVGTLPASGRTRRRRERSAAGAATAGRMCPAVHAQTWGRFSFRNGTPCTEQVGHPTLLRWSGRRRENESVDAARRLRQSSSWDGGAARRGRALAPLHHGPGPQWQYRQSGVPTGTMAPHEDAPTRGGLTGQGTHGKTSLSHTRLLQLRGEPRVRATSEPAV